LSVSIIGTSHTEFGRLDHDIYQLLVKSGKDALADSPVEAAEIGGVWIANYSGGGF
jgi:acetyl-CoA C-acetyltransferase